MDIRVTEADDGKRIDQVLANVSAVGSRSHAERLLRSGAVSVGGKTAAKSLRLRSGTLIRINPTALEEPALVSYANVKLDIVFEDDDVLVVNKPAGLVVHPAPGLREATLVDILRDAGVSLAPSADPAMVRPGVVHRLDRDTSGVILLAKTAAALRVCQNAIRARNVRREYLALVEGHVPSRAGRIEAAIGRDVRDGSRRSLETDKPKDALTHFVVQEILPRNMLLRIRLETGRTHQIRVHMQAIGYPVCGDQTYGNGSVYGLTRQFLHATRLTFPHPRTTLPVEVTAPLPDDLQEALHQARRAEAD